MIKNKKVIIFDLDGTLIESVGIWNDIDRELLKQVAEKEIDDVDIGIQRDQKLKEYSKYEDAYLEYCGFLKEKYNIPVLSKKEIKDLRYDIATDYLKNKVDYKPNAEKLLKFLKEKGFLLVVASATTRRTLNIYKEYNKNLKFKAELDTTFDLIYSKEDIKELKPNPEIHIKVMNELGVEPEDCLIFEDTLIGVEAANAARIDVAVMYDKYSDGNREEINRKAKYIFNDFDEVIKYVKKELGE